MSVLDIIIGLIAPHNCIGCRCEGNLICNTCVDLLPPGRIAQHEPVTVQSATFYTGLAKDLLWELKSSGSQAAAYTMARIIVQRCHLDSGSVLIPVPTATNRVRARGYDQAVLLAKAVGRKTALPCRQWLVRQNQAHQVGSNRAQRRQQLADAFRIKRIDQIVGQRIILIDDVSTTGATLETAARLLLRAGASQVEAITFAQA